jgi:hypothetical protein
VKRGLRAATVLIIAVGFVGLAVMFLPPVIWRDAPVPASLAAYMPTARQTLWANGIDGLRLPLYLTFIEARCAADGAVALIFEEHRPPWTETRFAYTARGDMPTAPDDPWGGGLGIVGSVLADEEFIHLMGADPALCQR